jgi:hypothetical protein
VGWALNLGAVAVHMGIIQPDDAVAALPTLTKAPILDRIAVRSLGYVVVSAILTRSRRSWTGGFGALIGLGCGLAPLRAAVGRAASTNGDCRER